MLLHGPMFTNGKNARNIPSSFSHKTRILPGNYCDVTKVEVPNCVFTRNMRNEFVVVRVYQAVKNPATTDEFAADFSFMPE